MKKRQAGNIGEEQTTADQSVEFKKASLVWGYLGGEIETGDGVQAEAKSSHFCQTEFIVSIQRCGPSLSTPPSWAYL